MKALLNEMVGKMDTGENFVYFQATRGSNVVKNHAFPEENKANVWINIFHKEILDLNKRIQLITMEEPYFVEDLFSADEVLISSAGALCLVADKIDDKEVDGKATELVKSIQKILLNDFISETDN